MAASGFVPATAKEMQKEAANTAGLAQEKKVLEILKGQNLLEQEELAYAIASLFQNQVAWFHFFEMLDEAKKPEIMGENYHFMGKKYFFEFRDKKHPIPYHSLDHAKDYFQLALEEAKKLGNVDLEVRAAIALAITKLLLVIYHKENRYLIPREQFLTENLAHAKKLLQDSMEKTKTKQEKNAINNLIQFHEGLVIEK